MAEDKILIIEDDPLVAANIKVALEKFGFQIIATANSYLEASDKIKICEPDLAFVDINLHGHFEGLMLAEHIHKLDRYPYIFLTAYADRKILEEAKKLQPSGYIVKPFDEHDLLASIEIALYNYAQRQKALSPHINWTTLNDLLVQPISQREVEVLNLVFEGRTNQQIASDLFVSLATIKSHLRRIYSKLNVNSRTAAMAKIRDAMR